MTIEIVISQIAPPMAISIICIIAMRFRHLVMAGTLAVILATGFEWLTYSSHMGWFDVVFFKNLMYLIAVNVAVYCVTSAAMIIFLNWYARRLRSRSEDGSRD